MSIFNSDVLVIVSKGNLSTADSTKGINDGNGAPGSGTGAAGAGTVGDSTFTQQETVNGAPTPKSPYSVKH